jgi:hypothetical protein
MTITNVIDFRSNTADRFTPITRITVHKLYMDNVASYYIQNKTKNNIKIKKSAS